MDFQSAAAIGRRRRGGAVLAAMTAAVALVVPLLVAAPAPAATIELWHAMNGELGRQLDQLAADFNASQSEYRVVPDYKGNYTETVTAAIFAVRTKKHPAIVQVNEIATATMMAAKGAIYPVFELMRDQGEPFDQAAYLPAVSGYYSDLAGNLLSFPFNASTPILYYNKDQFRAAGLDENAPPKTWPEVEAVARKLAASERPLRLHHPLAVLGQRRELLRLAQRADRDPCERPRRPRRGAHDRQPGDGAPPRGARRMAEDQALRLQRPRLHRRAALSGGRVRDVHRLVGLARRHPGEVQVRGRLRHAALLAGRRGRAAELDHRRRDAVGAARPAPGGVRRGGEVLRLSLAAAGPGVLAPEHRLSADHRRRLRALQGATLLRAAPGAAIGIEQIMLHPPTDNSRGLRLGSFVLIRDVIEEEMEQALAGKKSAKAALGAAVARGNELLRQFERTTR